MKFSFKRLFLRTIGRFIPSDFFAYRFPVSVKGVIFIDDKVVLLANERGEWDLPGGKLNVNEELIDCLEREIKEELGITVEVLDLEEVVKINIANKIKVIVLVYFCKSTAKFDELKLSGENFDLGQFSFDDLAELSLPQEYLSIIKNRFNEQVSKA